MNIEIHKRSIEDLIHGNYFVDGVLIEIYEDYDTEVIEQYIEDDIKAMKSFLRHHGIKIIGE